MMFPVWLLSVAALLTLVFGFEAWRLTSSKKLRVYTMVGTPTLAYAAYLAAHPVTVQKAAFVAFIVAVLFGGYAIGFWLRCRREPDFRRPALLLSLVAGAAFIGAAVTYLQA